MSWISNLSARNWRHINVGLIIILSALLILWPAPITSRVARFTLNTFHLPFIVVKTSLQDLRVSHEENRRLDDSLTELSVRLDLLTEEARENRRLREMLRFDRPAAYELLPARVLEISSEKPPRSALIDKGTVDLVMADQPVINRNGLVGRILEVLPEKARVQLLTDPENRVAARIASNREMGVVRYLPGDGLVLADFPNQGRVEIGDTVISSGLGGVYPSGLRIGVVTEVNRPDNRPDCEVRLRMCAHLESVEELFVLRPESP